MAPISCNKVDLVAVAAELSSSYVVLGRLALAKPLDEDSALCQIETLSEIFDRQLLCSECHLTSVPKLFQTPEDGILCEKCYEKRLAQPSCSANKEVILKRTNYLGNPTKELVVKDPKCYWHF